MKLQFLLNLYNFLYTVFQDLITTSIHRSEIFYNSLSLDFLLWSLWSNLGFGETHLN